MQASHPRPPMLLTIVGGFLLANALVSIVVSLSVGSEGVKISTWELAGFAGTVLLMAGAGSLQIYSLWRRSRGASMIMTVLYCCAAAAIVLGSAWHAFQIRSSSPDGPTAAVLSLAAGLAAAAFVGYLGWLSLRWRRAFDPVPQRRCPACGYDLRGSPSGGGGGCECPECGTSTPAPSRG